MNVTKALILINYIFTGEKEQLAKTIETCHEAFVVGECLCPQLEKEEMRDVKTFLEYNWSEGLNKSGCIQDKFNELYTKYIKKTGWVSEDI